MEVKIRCDRENPIPGGKSFSRWVSDIYVADVLIKNKKTFIAVEPAISASKGGQMYRVNALPFRLREFGSHPEAIVAGSSIFRKQADSSGISSARQTTTRSSCVLIFPPGFTRLGYRFVIQHPLAGRIIYTAPEWRGFPLPLPHPATTVRTIRCFR